MKKASADSALKVQAFLGPVFEVLEFDTSTRTSQDAAAAIGCEVAQIAKSLIFKARSGAPVMVIASGANRVDEKKVRAILGEKISRADAGFVREATGYAIGGVPPVAHATQARILLDRDLQSFDQIWAAGGTPNAVFRLTPADLQELTAADYVDIAKSE